MGKKEFLKFPNNFFWGASIASHQSEGGNTNQWSKWEKANAERLAREASQNYEIFTIPEDVWKRIEPEARDPQNYISGRSADHYSLYKEDVGIMKELNFNAFRFTIEWSRIEPEEGKFDQQEIEHYRQVIKALKENGIEPFVCLWHWTVPLWVDNLGNWQSKQTIKYFERFAEKMATEFKDDVKYWLTLNEPDVNTYFSYLLGIWPPQKKNFFAFSKTLNNLLKGHQLAFKVIKRENQNAQVGLALSQVYFEAHEGKIFNKLLKRISDFWANDYILKRFNRNLDFIGLNHYFYNRVDGWINKNENKIVSDMGWELYPESIYHSLKRLKRYNKPIIITENGLADGVDKYRGWYIEESLKYVAKAIAEGVDVHGYLHWSLLDNFEWDKGYWSRFGLVEVDYKTLERKIRPSAHRYAEIIKANGLVE